MYCAQNRAGLSRSSIAVGLDYLKVKDVVRTQPLRILLRYTGELINDGTDLGPCKTRGAEKDAGVRLLSLDGVPGQYEEMASVAGHKAAAFPTCIGKLFRIRKLDIPHLMSADGINPFLPQRLSDLG